MTRRFATASKPRARSRRSSSCASGPARPSTPAPLLNFTTPLRRISFNNTSLRDILNFIASSTAINVTFDRQYTDRTFTVQLDGVTLEQALNQILSVNQLSYKVLSEQSILVFDDNAQKHAQYDEQVIQTFYLSNADPTEMAQLLSTVFRPPGVAVQPQIVANKTANSITIRATAPMVQIFEKIIQQNDKPRAEIVVDIEIMEVNRQRVKQYGLNLSEYALGGIFSPEVSPAGTASITSGTTPAAGGGTTTTASASGRSTPPSGVASPPPFNLNTISRGFTTADFYSAVPTAIVKFLESDTNTKLVAKPQLRGAEGTKLTLKVGDQIPIISTSYLPIAGGGAGVNPLSSYHYKDVGVNIDMTPRVTLEGDILLDVTIINNSRGSDVNIGGVNIPSFGNREVTTRLRLRDGESNLLAGLLREDERQSLNGFPGAIHVPVLKQLFSQQRRADRPDRHRHAADAAHRARAGHHGSRSQADLHRVAAEPRARRPAAAHRAAAGHGRRADSASCSDRPLRRQGCRPSEGPHRKERSPCRPEPHRSRAPSWCRISRPRPHRLRHHRRRHRLSRRRRHRRRPRTWRRPKLRPRRPPAAAAQAANPPITSPGIGQAQVIISPPATPLRVGQGPYNIPISVTGATRLSTVTLTMVFDPTKLRVRTVQEGSFLRAGGANVTFSQQVDRRPHRHHDRARRRCDRRVGHGPARGGALRRDRARRRAADRQRIGHGAGRHGDGPAVPARDGDGPAVTSRHEGERLHLHRAPRRVVDDPGAGVGHHAADQGHDAADARGRAAARRCARCGPRSTSSRTRPTRARSARSTSRRAPRTIRRIWRRSSTASRRPTTRPAASSSSCGACPIDPMTKSTEWGLRSYQDDPNSTRWGGQDVFDVHTTSEGTAPRRHEIQGLVAPASAASRSSSCWSWRRF